MLLGGLLIFNISTCYLYPQVWCDEIWFSEPAVNMVREGEFQTRGFMFQPKHTFPVINCPLYLVAQIPWLAVAGTSLTAVRSFNYTLMAVSAFLVWVISWRFNLVKSAASRLLLVALLHLGYGMSYSYRCSRPDILGMTCLLLLLLSFGIRNPTRRKVALFGFATMTFWVGMQVAFFASFACFLAFVVLRAINWKELMLVAAGVLTGVATTLGFLWWKKVLGLFLPPLMGVMGRRYAHEHAAVSTKVRRVLSSVLSGYVEDFSTDILVLGLIVLLVAGWKRLSPRIRALNVFCLILVFGAPLLFDVVGHWAFYYSYLRYVPASLALFATAGELCGPVPPSRRVVFGAVWLLTVAGAMIVGLPLRLALAVTECRIHPRKEMLLQLRSHINERDVVLSDHAAFFEAKQIATEVYDRNYSGTTGNNWVSGGHEFSPEERSAMTVLVIRDQDANLMTNYFGGQWVPVGPPFGDTQDFGALARLPIVGRRFASYAVQPQNERYQLQIFKRAAPIPGEK